MRAVPLLMAAVLSVPAGVAASDRVLFSSGGAQLSAEAASPIAEPGLRARPAGLSLDLEACAVGSCLRASDGDRVVMSAGSSLPVRVRLHLDCARSSDVRMVASWSRVVVVGADQPTLHCPLVPQDAYCEFRYWPHETRWDREIRAEFAPAPAETAWPDAEGRVDEAEIELSLGGLVPGEYDLVAAIPKDVVDLHPCGEVRNHQWVESPPLRIEITEEPNLIQWHELALAARDAAAHGDLRGLAWELERMTTLAEEAPEGLLPLAGEEARRRMLAACPLLRQGTCADSPAAVVEFVGSAAPSERREPAELSAKERAARAWDSFSFGRLP